MNPTLVIVLAIAAAVGVFVLHFHIEAKDARAAKTLRDREADAVTKALTGAPGFTATRHIFGVFLECSLAVDDRQRSISLVAKRDGGLICKVYPHTALLDVALVEDGAVLTESRVSRGSQLAGAVVGSVLFGGVGAVVGGLSGKRVGMSTEVSRGMELRITVNDLDHPVWIVPFLRGALVRTSDRYLKTREQAIQWQGILSILIHAAENATNPYLP